MTCSAYSALATDAYAPVWNPSGLGFVKTSQLAGQHLSYLESIHYEHVGFVHPLKPGQALGISAQYLGTGDITGRNFNGDLTGDYSSHYGAYSLAYGRAITDRLALGLTGKWINAKIAEVSANAYAVDLGSLYKATEKLSLAATLTNLGTQLKFLNDGDDLPLAGRFGAAYQVNRWSLLTSDVSYRKSGLASWHGGLAWRPLEAVSLRAGYKTDTLKELSALAGVTAGVGIYAWGQELSYAWAPYGDLGDAQYFSLLVRFGAEEEKRRNLIQYQSIKSHRQVRYSHPAAQESQDIDDVEFQQILELITGNDPRLAGI